MMEQPYAPHLLRDLYATGEQMCGALKSNDLNTFFNLVQERETLITQLRGYAHASEVDPDWERYAALMKSQHHDLQQAMTERQQQMAQMLEGFVRFKEAKRSYAAHPRPEGILHEHVHG